MKVERKCIFVPMLRLFFSNQSYALLAAPVIMAVYITLNIFTQTFHPPEVNSIDLGLWGSFNFNQQILGYSIAPVLIIFSAILLNFIFNRNEFFDRNTYLPALLYITAASFFPYFYYLNGLGIAQFFLVLSLFNFFRLNQNEDAKKVLFNGSFLWSLACTVFPPLIFLFPILFVIMWTFRPFIFRESVMLIMGMLVPYIYVVAYYFLSKKDYHAIQLTTSSAHVGQITVVAVSSGILLFVMLSLKSVLRNLQQGSIRLRKIMNMVMWFAFGFVAVTSVDFIFFNHTGSAALLLLPLMFLIPYGFGQKKLRSEAAILYYVFFMASVSNFFISYLL